MSEPAISMNTVSGYERIQTARLPHLGATLHELVHARTGARHVHLECDDENNAFSAIFLTIPNDSTGVAHILEHSVLDGSRNYPIRAPYFSMATRTLATFMNAMTSADRTQYPFSSRNRKDFYNLLDIYLDATFYPLLTEDTFKQEGHRTEFKRPGAPDSGLRFKGVVFNEMKAGMGSASTAMTRALCRSLFAGMTYEHRSGGEPERIPDLTWQQLKDFHARHYHPSNARFYTYGNLPLEPTLERIEERVMQHFERRAIDLTIPDVARVTTPRTTEARYPLAPGEDPLRKGQALVGWVTVPVADPYQRLSMRVLADTLLSNPSSPLRHALISSGVGSTVADGTALIDDGFKEAVFAAGVKDLDPADAGKVEELVLETLDGLTRRGLDRDQVESAIHQLELTQRERSNAPFGNALKMMLRVGTPYIYGGDIARVLDFDADLERLRAAIPGGRLEQLIAEQLVANLHRVTVVGIADADIEGQREERELARLSQLEAALSEEGKQRMVADALRLRARQDHREDLSILPSVGIQDVDVQVADAPGSIERIAGVKVEFYPQPTGGLTYVELRADAAGLPEDLTDHLGVLAYVLSRVGAGELDDSAMAARIAAHTGGIQAAAELHPNADGGFGAFLQIASRALERNQAELLSIITDLAVAPQFEPDRLIQLVREHLAQIENGLPSLSMNYVRLLAAGHQSPGIGLQERFSGPTHVRLLRRLADAGESGAADLAARLKRLAADLFQSGRLDLCVTAREETLPEIRAHVDRLLAAIPPGPRPGVISGSRTRHGRVALTAPVAVAANLMAFSTVTYSHPDAPALPVMARYLWATYLHREIREKGGAYTSAASADSTGGFVTLLSASDPNIERTYDVFRGARAAILDLPIADPQLEEAILASARVLDPLESPDMRGRRTSLHRRAGLTPALREAFFRKTLGITAADVRRVAELYLNPESASWATVASTEALSSQTGSGLFEVIAPLI